MTHDKLLIKLLVMDANESEQTRLSKTTQALRVIVELHKPYKVNDVYLCDAEPLAYPCPTIQAIEKELI
jgi:hypothetical protein